MRKWNSKTPSRRWEKTPVGGIKTILKRASGDCVEGSETQAWSTAQGRRQGIASNKAGQSQVWQRRQAAEVCKQQGNCLEASAEVYNMRQWSTVETAPTENTSVHGHDSYLGSSLGEKRCLQGTRLPSYRRTCKKGSPEAWPRQGADEVVPDSRPQQRQYSAVCETDTNIQRERKTTDVKVVYIDWTQEET